MGVILSKSGKHQTKLQPDCNGKRTFVRALLLTPGLEKLPPVESSWEHVLNHTLKKKNQSLIVTSCELNCTEYACLKGALSIGGRAEDLIR